MQDNNDNQVFQNALTTLKQEVEEHELDHKIIIKGSFNEDSDKYKEWSDIDLSVIAEDITKAKLDQYQDVYKAFKSEYPKIKLSFTVINEGDNPKTNPLHHHGIKPIAFNKELQTQTDLTDFSSTFNLQNEAYFISSAYRYYEILYEMRKDLVEDNTTQKKFVSKYFHRVPRFIRTQLEIFTPSLLEKTSMIDEEEHHSKLPYAMDFRTFFQRRHEVKADWKQIKSQPDKLRELETYLTNFMEESHKSFLPYLKRKGISELT